MNLRYHITRLFVLNLLFGLLDVERTTSLAEISSYRADFADYCGPLYPALKFFKIAKVFSAVSFEALGYFNKVALEVHETSVRLNIFAV